jgi:calcineurin-like phosphoesterase family protein
MTQYFTSDTHFGHERIIEYCKRPFTSLHEMNVTMTKRWNETVGPEDEVFHLGDFAFGSAEKVEQFRRMLNGRIILIQGTHDRVGKETLRRVFDGLHETLTTVFDGKTIHMSHRPSDLTPTFCDYFLNGLVHDRWRYFPLDKRMINVGVDQWEFRPRRLAELTDWGNSRVSILENKYLQST